MSTGSQNSTTNQSLIQQSSDQQQNGISLIHLFLVEKVKPSNRFIQEHATLKRDQMEDRGVRSVVDGYSTTAFLLQHFGFLRGESIRMMEFADLQSMLLEREGATECYALVMVLLQGKTNQEGRVEFAACIRNRNVEICPQMTLSFYLFHRWHIQGEPFSSLNQNKDWYRLKLIKSADLTVELSYSQHLDAISSAFKEIGLHSKAKTHAMRGSGARMAEQLGTSESFIQRLGRWNSNALSKKYLTNVPREVLRTLAGFTAEAGQFYLSCAAVIPPPELCRKVFPWVDVWRQRLDNG
ncbi:hypothetical protein INT45_009484 [Circinella minor]|uniref:Ndc10 domain-containing protein n=1 Tax=Circinella minor TaxID=1195481 RepID=A0A8H7VLL9_9FUNG|nr:hypothetical protein INT45_009484 [Circinella minor]